MTSKRKPWFMDIKDKIPANNSNYCPPHRIPHTLPIIGKLIIDEACHYHSSKLRMLHHQTFCRLLKCPNYETMMQQYKKHKNNKK